MKTVIYQSYGTPKVLQLKERPKPIPGKKEFRIKVHSTTVTAADCIMRKAESFSSRLILGWMKPRKKYQTLGIEFAGEVESLGNGANKFRLGDRVYGFLGFNPGSYAEYLCISENASIATIPGNLGYSQAVALVDSTTTALYFLMDKAHLGKGQRILIIGASGSLGSAAVQIAASLGAKVAGVCSSRNKDYVLSLGAENVIDYTHENYTLSPERYDVIFDTVGKVAFRECKKILNPKGKYLRCNGKLLANYIMNFIYKFSFGKRFIFGMSVNKQKNLDKMQSLIEKRVIKPMIDRVFPLEDIVLAHHYVEKGHKRGNVIIEI